MSRVFNGIQNARLSYDVALTGIGITGTPVLALAWVKPATLDFNGQIVGCHTQGGSPNAFHIQLRSLETNDPLRFRLVNAASSTSDATLNNALSTSAWKLVAMKYVSSTSRFAGVIDIDGESVTYGSEQTTSNVINFAALNILSVGAFYQGTYGPLWNGKIGQIGLWQGTVPSDANIVTAASQADWTGLASAGIIDIWTMNAAGNETGIVNGITLTNVSAGLDANDNPVFVGPGPSVGDEVLLTNSGVAMEALP